MRQRGAARFSRMAERRADRARSLEVPGELLGAVEGALAGSSVRRERGRRVATLEQAGGLGVHGAEGLPVARRQGGVPERLVLDVHRRRLEAEGRRPFVIPTGASDTGIATSSPSRVEAVVRFVMSTATRCRNRIWSKSEVFSRKVCSVHDPLSA